MTTSLTEPTAASTSTVTSANDWSKATWILLVVLCGALFLDGLDISMVGVALPSIGRSLHLAASSLQWIVSGYVLGYGGLLLLGGRASDLLGRRRVFLVAVAVFGVASMASAFLSNDTAIIALRFVKGASAAFTVPAGLSIITTTFTQGPARSKALSIYTACGASGFSLGLVFGGLLTELGWRATFIVPGPVALALVIAGFRVVPRVKTSKVALAQFDLFGALTSTLGLLVFVYAVVEAPARGWASAATIGGLGLAGVLLTTFVFIERHHQRPLLRLGILRSQPLRHANLAGAVMFGSYAAFQFITTLYLQDSLHWSPIAMAMGFLPTGGIVAASAPRMGRILERFPTEKLIGVGLACLCAGYLLFLRISPQMPYVDFMLPTMLLLGCGFAVTFPSVNSQATSGVANHEQGLASGLVNTSIQVGGAVGLAIIAAIIGTRNATASNHHLLPGMTTAIAVVAGIAMIGVLATVARLVAVRRAVRVARLDTLVLEASEA